MSVHDICSYKVIIRHTAENSDFFYFCQPDSCSAVFALLDCCLCPGIHAQEWIWFIVYCLVGHPPILDVCWSFFSSKTNSRFSPHSASFLCWCTSSHTVWPPGQDLEQRPSRTLRLMHAGLHLTVICRPCLRPLVFPPCDSWEGKAAQKMRVIWVR